MDFLRRSCASTGLDTWKARRGRSSRAWSAVEAVLSCRTERRGGHVHHCPTCRRHHYTYHSCNQRACPRCGAAEQAQWTRRQEARLLPASRLSADADGSSADAQRVPALSRGNGSGVLCSHCQCAESVVRPQEVPRWEYRIHNDLAYMDPADALSSPHPCARSGSGSRSKRLRAETSA